MKKKSQKKDEFEFDKDKEPQSQSLYDLANEDNNYTPPSTPAGYDLGYGFPNEEDILDKPKTGLNDDVDFKPSDDFKPRKKKNKKHHKFIQTEILDDDITENSYTINLKVIGIIAAALFFVGLFCLTFFGFKAIKINLSGESNIEIGLNEKYEDLGASACYGRTLIFKNVGCKNISDIQVENNVDTTKEGTYEVVYTVFYKGKTSTLKRIVTVIDKQAPVITLVDPANNLYCKNTEFKEPGYTATDSKDGDITSKVKIKSQDEDKIVYIVTDSDGNSAEITRNLTYGDTEKPIITLVGDSTITIKTNAEYSEPGYTATDNCDGDITSKVLVDKNINSAKPGTYTVSYSVTDSEGNSTSASRNVVVKKTYSGSTGGGTTTTTKGYKGNIYLTFNSSLTQYTLKILDVLDKYGVKATFFTSFENGNKLYIGNAYNRGNAVGLLIEGTNQSMFFGDSGTAGSKNKTMDSVIHKKTNIIRFRVGSQSVTYDKSSFGSLAGFLTQVKKYYHVYDWDIDASNAGGTSASTVSNYVLNSLKSNSSYIIVLYDGNAASVDVAETVVKTLKNNGCTFSVLS